MTLFSKYIKMVPVVVCALILLTACGGRKTIPDRDLRNIFKDVFVANAYLQSQLSSKVGEDSLDVYRPILASYGYNLKDFEHTLANFSKRKSVKISNVVEQAINELEEEESWYRYQASILDSIDSRSQRLFGRQIIKDSSFRATRIADTARLRIAMPVDPGIYEISYYYLLDSLDKNRGLKTTYVVTDGTGKTTSTNTSFLSSRRQTKIDIKITPGIGDSLLTIRFGNYPDNLTTPGLRIDSVNIYYKPELRAALDSMDNIHLGYRKTIKEWLP